MRYLEEYYNRSEPKEIFELYRTEDISLLNSAFPVDRMKLIATDFSSKLRVSGG